VTSEMALGASLLARDQDGALFESLGPVHP
jgi:hypothetical protein